MISFEELRDNWAIIAGFAAGLIAWGKTSRDVEANKKQASEDKERLDATIGTVADLKTSIGELNVHAQYTREGIDDIKETIRDLRSSLKS